MNPATEFFRSPRPVEGVEGATIHTLYGDCPTQGFGTVGSWSWYFRARGGGWSLDVGKGAADGSDYVDYGHEWHDEGDDPACGYMEADAALAIIAESLGRYVRGDSASHTPVFATPEEYTTARDLLGQWLAKVLPTAPR